jgi:S-adenosylmethionine:diacylglycerol 3-amino-3-carboxypropyl transferase
MSLKFAVVREDAEVEAALVRRLGARAVLLVASGGCTALTLAHRFEGLSITAFDFNPDQLAHVFRKAEAAARGDLAALNVDDPRPDGINQCGEFEALFRLLRTAIEELVGRQEIPAWFADPDAEARSRRVQAWFGSRWWPAVFATVFNDPLLHAMFGPEATQHAAPGSYPGYFQRAFERGLRAEDGPRNPFLQHVLLGRYGLADAPPYVHARRVPTIDLVHGGLKDVPDLGRFDLLSLSNVFDWSDDTVVAAWGARIAEAARPGATVLVRQLNNRREIAPFFPGFRFDDALGASLLATDRSLFYERILVGFRG